MQILFFLIVFSRFTLCVARISLAFLLICFSILRMNKPENPNNELILTKKAFQLSRFLVYKKTIFAYINTEDTYSI